MESSRRSAYLLPILLLLVGLLTSPPLQATSDLYADFNEEEVDARLKILQNNAVPVRNDDVVKAFIKAYLYKHRKKSEEILGRTLMYFPLFEQMLKEHDLPEDLKYLSIVESALVPRAESRVGAVGLWQFMPGTAKENGLRIDYYVDERQDPVKSTRAAIRYLTSLYERYDDWALALAAYNSGPGRVNRAIRRGRSRDFWRIRRYLPRETRNYVPAFLAVTYLANHYQDHQLKPVYPTLDEQITETITVREEFTFHEIARVTGLSFDLIQGLNPAYLLKFIPANARGHHLTLPKRVMPAFQEYMEVRDTDNRQYLPLISTPVYKHEPGKTVQEYYGASTYTVRPGETLETVAANLNCSVLQLQAWNQLRDEVLLPGQNLQYFLPNDVKRFQLRKPLESFGALPKVGVPAQLTGRQEFTRPSFPIYYDMKSKRKTRDLAKELPGIDPERIKKLNNLDLGETLRPGQRIILDKI